MSTGLVFGGPVVDLPSGTVTLLFTDIEGSTQLLHELGERYADTLSEHRRLPPGSLPGLRGPRGGYPGGRVLRGLQSDRGRRRGGGGGSAGTGRPGLALGGEIRVRMGLHTGALTLAGGGYVGLDVHRTARLCAARGDQLRRLPAPARGGWHGRVSGAEAVQRCLPCPLAQPQQLVV